MAQEYWIRAPRFIKQVGESVPRYIEASPSMPAKVILEDDAHLKQVKDKDGKVVKIVEDKGLKLGDAPEKPIKAAVGAAGTQKEPVKKSYEPKSPGGGGRAADK